MPDPSSRRHSRAWLIPALIAAAAAGVLVYWTLTARPMWVDEEMLALNVRDRGFLQLTGPLWLDQSAPFGWLVLERLMMLVFGTGERAVRALTVIFGIGTLSTAWWIGRRWMTPFGAAVLVALCGTGEWLVFFTLELKHYSADAAGALLVPALAAWVLDADSRSATDAPWSATALAERQSCSDRIIPWWSTAAAAMWFSNGALFVTPLCALVLLRSALRRRTAHDVNRFLIGGVAWLASFAAIYTVVLRHALANAYLKNYWAFALPPTSEGIGALVAWFGAQLAPFAVKPIGSGTPALFWAVYVVGILVGLLSGSSVAMTFATVPISLLALAVAGFVPTFERLAIWSVPAFYVGIALCADVTARRVPLHGWHHRAIGLVLAILVLVASYDVVRRGVFAIEHRPASNYGLDDRGSVRWLVDARRPGDAVMSTHYGLAGIWWYAGIDIADPVPGGRMADDAPLYEIHHVEDERECARWSGALDAIARDRSRIVVYLGFRMNVEPDGFDRLVLEEFGRRWPLVGYKEYAELSRVAIFDLKGTPGGRLVIPSKPGPSPSEAVVRTPPGCVSVTPARRW
ncbi:MAG TPA: hypothetical protein VF219_19445 [Vicinamibacterales bacterium]